MLHDDDLLSPDYMNIIGKLLPKIRKQNNTALVKAKSLPIRKGKVISLSFIKRKVNEWGAAKLIPYGKKDLAVIGPERVGILGACSCGSLMNKKIYCNYGGFDETHFPCADAYYPERLVMKHNYLAYYTVGVLGYYRYEENAQWKVETLLGYAQEYMIYRQYYGNRDWLSRFMYRLFQSEMLYETKKSILRLGQESKFIETSDFKDFKNKVSKIMGSSIGYSSIKRVIYNGTYYLDCRMKIIAALLFGR